ncbi:MULTISPECIES: MltA domain-containing protein [unclassified Minwuia]|jgi:peptidoglycan lytic transglycosylase A|uniref:murein transglycosylase A n=1 Tax=unclassified Minwuia TaxID=2618799 RepID=UPI002479F666|nr:MULTISPECIES: MltA domain-containing protein [unclassified Minwuia]
MRIEGTRLAAAALILIAVALFVGVVLMVPQPPKIPDASHALTPATFDDLPGWKADDVSAIAPSLLRQCARWKWRRGELADAMRQVCTDLKDNTGLDRGFIEARFDVWALQAEGPGLLTGYFEPTYEGRRQAEAGFQVPLLPRPDDLIDVDLASFRPDLKGTRIAGRLEGQKLVPYADRSAIRSGALADTVDPIFWLADPVDLFFLQIQGSGRIALPGGEIAYVGYAAQNGHPYRAIGRDLIASGAIARADMSMQAIRQWLAANPVEAEAIMDLNPSYVFFQERKGVTGAIGAAGTQLTPGRSIAVDRRVWTLGLPMFVATEAQGSDPEIHRLTLAEDTGGAIRGPRRADLFLGPGDEAARLAGSMNRPLDLWLLYPKGLLPENAVVAE